MEPYKQLENEFADFLSCRDREFIACSSGTSALHLALEALELPLGSKVLVPDFSMIAIPRAVIMAGHQPVFADCDKLLNLRADNLIEHFGTYECSEVKAAIIVHTYGRAYDMDPLLKLAEKYDWKVIEDLAEAHGVRPHPKSYAACWSFYKNKIVAGEEGGMVAVKDSHEAGLIRELKTLGFTSAHNFWHRPRGVNARMSNAHANLILRSLYQYSSVLLKRRRLEHLYSQAISTEYQIGKRQAPWVFDIRIPGCTFELLDKIVGDINADFPNMARHGFKPNSLQEEFKWLNKLRKPRDESFRASQEVMYLSLDPTIEESKATRIGQRLEQLLKTR